MSVDSADAPPPPPPPPPPRDYSVADQPVVEQGPPPPDSASSSSADAAPSGADTAGVTGSGALDGQDGLAPADEPVVDQGEATPDLAAGTDRTAWDPAGESSDLPSSMQEDLNQLGEDLRSDVDPDAWAKADQDDRAAMLADANDKIRDTYGLQPSGVNYSSDLPEGVTGQYDPGTGDITLNSSLLEDQSPDEAIKTLSHENFHDYQQEAIDGNGADPYAESRVDAWTAGQAGYDAEDFTAYMANPLEADAFAAERAVFEGYQRK